MLHPYQSSRSDDVHVFVWSPRTGKCLQVAQYRHPVAATEKPANIRSKCNPNFMTINSPMIYFCWNIVWRSFLGQVLKSKSSPQSPVSQASPAITFLCYQDTKIKTLMVRDISWLSRTWWLSCGIYHIQPQSRRRNTLNRLIVIFLQKNKISEQQQFGMKT